MSQIAHCAALQDFFRWERQSWVEVVADITSDEKSYFMPVETLKSYFKANGNRKLNKILSEIFQSEDIPIDPKVILRGHTAVFCILLRISKGKYIEEFARFEELSDQRLPFDPTHPPAYFPEIVDDPDFLQRFCDKQWMYCVPIFDSHMLHKHLGHQRLLPITQKEICEGGGSVTVYKIKLYGPHNNLIPAESEIQTNNADPNTFILKRYLTKDGYRQEIKNFSGSKHSDSIRRFYGSYSHGDSYNILLEYADKGSLNEYFQKQTPPSHGEDIIKFWDGLFQLIKALKTIHSILGWHQDVKPSSVLVLSYGTESAFDWRFKLADFGLSHSLSKASSDGKPIANDPRGAKTYGAPECYMHYNPDAQRGRTSSKITQVVDIWSLGCIYSEAAIWIADGYHGVMSYRQQRIAETEKVPNFNGGDCFHDGERVLKTVLDTHKDIELRLRRSDYITKDVLDSMVEEMLWEEDRPGAKALWRRAAGVLSRARKKLSSNTTDVSFTKPNNNSRSITYPLPPYPPHPPPQRPLPERPRVVTPRSDPSQRQYSTNVEMWRSQVRVPSGELTNTSQSGEQKSSPESISELDIEHTSSASSWHGGYGSSVATPLTSPFTSPHASTLFDFQGQIPTEGRRGTPQSQRSPGRRISSKRTFERSNTTATRLSDDSVGAPAPLAMQAEFPQESIALFPTDIKKNNDSIADNSKTMDRSSPPLSNTYSAPMTNLTVQGNSISPPISVEDIPPLPQSSQKRLPGLSLFPKKANQSPAPTPPPPVADPVVNDSSHYESHVARSDSLSNASSLHIPSSLDSGSRSVGHLSLAAALEWKRAHKKSKKNARVPSVSGVYLLNGLKDRDHAFIIDDGISMRKQWPRVKAIFEALSYILKPMAPDGIELYFTGAYDAWRRHNTSELVDFLEKKDVTGDTDIAYRLGLQLQDHMIKTQAAINSSKKSKKLRPRNFYIFTDGNWKAGSDPTPPITDLANFLIENGLGGGHVTIQFISFGQDPEALQRIDAVANADFGLDLVDTTPSTDNILKMLCGALNKSRFQGCSALPTQAGSASTLVLPLPTLPPIGLT